MAKAELTDTRVQGRDPGVIDLTDRNDGTDPDVFERLERSDVQSEFTAGGAQGRRDISGAAREIVRRARAQQGLPEKIEDATTISRIATLLQPGDAE